jgi:hypothetical protein
MICLINQPIMMMMVVVMIRSYMRVVQKIAREGGVKGFYKGYTPCVIRAFPANAACFMGYEVTKNLLS